MRAVGIKVLKNKLSEYVRLAEKGETVLVTDRDRVVAELRSPECGTQTLAADLLAGEAVRKGYLKPPLFPPGSPPPRRLPVAKAQALQDELSRDRGAR